MLIRDRDAEWGAAVRARLGEAGIRVVQTPYRAPDANADAERRAAHTHATAAAGAHLKHV